MASRAAPKAARKVVIAGVPDGALQDDVMADILMIHFQMSKNRGGDVEEVEYPTRLRGVAYVTFEDQEVAESVLQKGDHQLQDKRLSRPYPLKVTRYCEEVFTSVTSVLDMSVFKEQFVLEDLLQEIQRRSRALSFGPLQANGHVSVRGSFPEMKLLGDFLLLKAKCLSEEDRRGESQSHQRTRRRLQQQQLKGEHDADRESQMVVLDTDVYCYMKAFSPWRLQGSADVVISATTDGDATTLYLESAGPKSAVGQISRIREQIEEHSVELYGALRKERLSFKEHSRAERERYQRLCAHLEPHFPHLLMIHYDTHIDVVGSSPEILQFTKEVSSRIRSW